MTDSYLIDAKDSKPKFKKEFDVTIDMENIDEKDQQIMIDEIEKAIASIDSTFWLKEILRFMKN